MIGPQVKEMTAIKCHDESRKMSLLLVLERDLKKYSWLPFPHLPTLKCTHSLYRSLWPIAILKEIPLTRAHKHILAYIKTARGHK